eukprot:542180_1
MSGKHNSPLLDLSESYIDKRISESIGGIGNQSYSFSFDKKVKSTSYQSFDTFSDTNANTFVHQHEHESKTSKIKNLLIIIISLIVGISIIILSILNYYYNKNDQEKDFILFDRINLNFSYMILSISFGLCFVLCSLYKYLTTFCCTTYTMNFSIFIIFIILSCIMCFVLSILGFLSLYLSIYITSITYPLWLCISLLLYGVIIGIFSFILCTINKDKFQPLHSEQREFHTNTPQYIRKYGPLHPYDRSLFHKIWHSFTHQWLWNIIKLGYKQPLEIYDCYDVPIVDNIETQIKKWDKYVNTKQFKDNKFSTFNVMCHMELMPLIFRAAVYFMALLTSLSVPFIISALANFYEDTSIHIRIGLLLSFCLWLAAFIRIMILAVVMTISSRAFCRMRAFLIYVVYRKAINMTLTSDSTIGQKITIMANDTKQIAMAFAHLHWMSANLMLALLICMLLFYEIGSAAFIGWIFFIFFSGPIQMFLGSKVHGASKRYIQFSDIRVKFISEMLRGIEVTKMYCWEHALLSKVDECRKKEMKQLLIRVGYSSVLSMMNISTTHLMLLLMLG